MISLEAETAACELLEMLWGDRGFPVDPITIGKKLGLKIVETTLPKEVSGAIIKKANSDPIIIVEQQDSKNRKRFTCAHEIGHFIYRSEVPQNESQDEYSYVDLRSETSSGGTNEEEVFANNFAASLLMPREEFKKRHSDKPPNFELAAFFGVSVEAIGFRLKNLGLKC